MSDSIQKTSSNPLPPYQTMTGQHDPLPPAGQEATQKAEDASHADKTSDTTSSFNDYLNQQSITQLEKAQKGAVFDPAADIASNTPYQGGGQTGPI